MTTTPAAPTGTYRLQLHAGFGFADAAAIVPYLAELGSSHVYCSPILTAVPGSVHGYDVIDHGRLSAELGGDEGWAQLIAACRANGLGIVVDVVPNHMALPVPERLNAAWWDVLRCGESSAYASWFDIDWAAGGGKVLVPVLGRPLADCLRDGEIAIDIDAGVVRYSDHEFPLAPGTDKLDAQHYRLAHWRIANEELNYRRFFDVTTLAGLRAELPEVFDATHARLLELLHAGEIDGLRIDHPDGLADPAGYLRRLRATGGGRWTVVEKILEGDEVLPGWDCDGTTGYDAAAAITNVLVDPAAETAATENSERLTGRTETFAQTVAAGKRLAVERLFVAEVDRLLRDLEPVRRADLDAADFTARSLRAALVELLVHLDVYRAYAGDPASAERLAAAVEASAAALPHQRGEIAWLGRVLAAEIGGTAAESFAVRFEQTTGPVMAKGVEDTAFYRYLRLTALNEVGGDPGRFGRPVSQFHDFCSRLARDWPCTMTTLSTHDTKRSEDVRARLFALAEVPDEWAAAVTSWRERVGAPEQAGIDANTDYLIWQTLVGAGPITLERLLGYLTKATKEAKERTSWTDPDETYEQAVQARARCIFDDAQLLADIEQWTARTVAGPGRSNSLAQKLLQLTMPGIPDVYQGQELPDLSLVDPDNRRPVDYQTRRTALGALSTGEVDPKLLVTARTLRLRRAHPDWFAAGYEPVSATGPAAEHALAFVRGNHVVTVVTRLPVTLARSGGWADTTLSLPAGTWRNALTGEAVTTSRLADIVGSLQVALLITDCGDVA